MAFVSRLSAASEETKIECAGVCSAAGTVCAPTYDEVFCSIERLYHDQHDGSYRATNLCYFGENMRYFVGIGPQDTKAEREAVRAIEDSWHKDLMQLSRSFEAKLPSDERLRFRALSALNEHDMKLLCTTLTSWFATGKYMFRDHFHVMK